MTDNATIINESTNATTNSTGYWRPFEKGELPNITEWLLGVEQYVVDMIVSWGLDPVHILFLLVFGAICLIAIYYAFVKVTSGSSKMFVPIFYIAITLIILLLFEVI